MAPKSLDPTDLLIGAGLQCLEAATLGMPFEVWKTRMGRFRNESTIQSFKNLLDQGVLTFWKGLGPKLVESATKGSILLFSKEAIYNSCTGVGVGSTLSGFIAGAGGGICQVVVMSPCTFIVTAMVTSTKGNTAMGSIKETFAKQGIKGFYAGGSAIAFRQASNWASRQGLTEFCRNLFKDPEGKINKKQELLAGIIGGALSCWNHPFEVARIEMQARAHHGQEKQSMVGVLKSVHQEYGIQGLFKGVFPRILLGIWQTLFMVSAVKIVKEQMNQNQQQKSH